MDVVVSNILRSEGRISVSLLSIPHLHTSTIHLPDSDPDLFLLLHLSDRSFLLEYYHQEKSLKRVLIRRGSLQFAAVSSEIQSFRPSFTLDKHSPFRIFGRLQVPPPVQSPEYILYSDLLYTFTHFSSPLRSTLRLTIQTITGEKQGRYSVDFIPDPSLLYIPQNKGELHGKVELYDAYVTPWYVLLFGKDGKLVTLWRFKTGEMQVMRLKKEGIRPFVAQRSCGNEGYFLDDKGRIVILTEGRLKFLHTQRYTLLKPLLYLHFHQVISLPKPLFQDLCLTYFY